MITIDHSKATPAAWTTSFSEFGRLGYALGQKPPKYPVPALQYHASYIEVGTETGVHRCFLVCVRDQRKARNWLPIHDLFIGG